MRTSFRVAILICCCVLLRAPCASALSVAPLVLELSSGSTNRTAQFLVENDSASAKPVEVTIFEVEMLENGEQRRTLAPSEFVIFPAARLLPAHSKQLFRVQWAGGALAKSKTYVFALNELAVKMPEEKSGVQVVFNFDVVANIAPPSGSRTLDIIASEVVNRGGHRYASLLLSNAGNVHARLSDATVTLRSGSWTKVISPGELQLLLGVGLVQPGKKRRLIIPFDLPAQVMNVVAEISYQRNLK
jgi:fimbrial chaperone protein